jgi:hypothetical protein
VGASRAGGVLRSIADVISQQFYANYIVFKLKPTLGRGYIWLSRNESSVEDKIMSIFTAEM